MQPKHLIVFALAAMVILIGFNVFNSSRHEQNRIAMASSNSAQTTMTSDESNNAELAIASQPLSEQPKAIIDKVNTEVAQAQQANEQRYLEE